MARMNKKLDRLLKMVILHQAMSCLKNLCIGEHLLDMFITFSSSHHVRSLRTSAASQGHNLPKERLSEESDSDFSDLDQFLDDSSIRERRITKRKMRHLQKQMVGDSDGRRTFSN